MEGKAEVVEQTQGNLSRAFENRREQWAHMVRGGAIKSRQDYTRYNTFVRPLVAALDRNTDMIWNNGMRLPFLTANKAIEVIKGHIPTKTASSE